MVNDTGFQHRYRLLHTLRGSSKPVSGEKIGETLGISRVAVHKHVNILQKYGYPIHSSRDGYSLSPYTENEILSPWEFGKNENVIVYQATGSTMDRAREYAELQPDRNITIVADRQIDGRGRNGSCWISQSGGLWTTRILHADGSAHRIVRFTLAACSALSSVLQERFGLDARLRWPGDVLVDGMKIAGALSEAHIEGERLRWIALGLGIHVNNSTYPGNAVSLKKLTGKTIDRISLLRSWTKTLDKLHSGGAIESDDEPAWWNKNMADIGKQARFLVYKAALAGKAGSPGANTLRIDGRIEKTDGLGRLCVAVSSGTVLALPAGDVREIRYKNGDISER